VVYGNRTTRRIYSSYVAYWLLKRYPRHWVAQALWQNERRASARYMETTYIWWTRLALDARVYTILRRAQYYSIQLATSYVSQPTAARRCGFSAIQALSPARCRDGYTYRVYWFQQGWVSPRNQINTRRYFQKADNNISVGASRIDSLQPWDCIPKACTPVAANTLTTTTTRVRDSPSYANANYNTLIQEIC